MWAFLKVWYKRNKGLLWPIVIGQIIGYIIAEIVVHCKR